MILHSFDKLSEYSKLNPHFAKAFQWINHTDLEQLAHGKTIIDSDNIFAIKETLPGRESSKARLEAHKKYIDIQICIKGIDSIKWKEVQNCHTILQEYKEDNDIMFFMDDCDQYIKVYDKIAAIFFPSDAHAPLIADHELTKVVIKVKNEA